MPDAHHLVEELLLPSAFALFVFAALWRRWPAGWDPNLWSRHACWTFVALRIGLPVGLFVLMGVGVRDWGSDSWYWVEGTDALLRGGVPGRDFPNAYGPLLPYVQTVGRWMLPGRHWVGVLLPFVVGDALALWFGARLARELVPPGAGPDGGARAAAWVGSWLLLTPLTWYLLAVRGQDEQLLAGTLLVGLWLVHRERPTWAGVALGLGLAATKPTYALQAGAILLAVPLAGGRALRAWGGFVGTVVGAYAVYVATGAEAFVPGDLEDVLNNYGNGLSLPDLARRYAVPLSVGAAGAAYVVAVAVAALVVSHRARGRPSGERAVLVSATVSSVTMIAAPMCVAPYVTQGLAFALLVLVVLPESSPSRTLAAALLALLGLLVPLLWVFPATVMEPLVLTSLLTHAVLLVLVWRQAGVDP